MANQTPIPPNPIGENFAWRDWFQVLSDRVFGTASTLDIPIEPEFGGTGLTTYNTGDIIYSNSTNNLTRLPSPAATSLLQMTAAGVPSWSATGYGDTLNPYASKTAKFVLAAPNASSGVPTFRALVASDIPTKTHGVFYDTTTQTAAVINTAYAMTFNTTALSSSVSIGSPTSRIVTSNAGVYNFQFSAQLHKTSASVGYVYIWFRVNGTDITDSASKVALSGSQAETVAAWNYVASMAASDYFEIMWSTSSTDCQLLRNTSTSPVPGIPSVILTVQQI